MENSETLSGWKWYDFQFKPLNLQTPLGTRHAKVHAAPGSALGSEPSSSPSPRCWQSPGYESMTIVLRHRNAQHILCTHTQIYIYMCVCVYIYISTCIYIIIYIWLYMEVCLVNQSINQSIYLSHYLDTCLDRFIEALHQAKGVQGTWATGSGSFFQGPW